jgi:hypothetical protein
MKKKIVEIEKKKGTEIDGKMISRKEAIKKTGYLAVSAATMMILLNNPSYAHASQPAPCPKPNPGNGGGGGGIWKKK